LDKLRKALEAKEASKLLKELITKSGTETGIDKGGDSHGKHIFMVGTDLHDGTT